MAWFSTDQKKFKRIDESMTSNFQEPELADSASCQTEEFINNCYRGSNSSQLLVTAVIFTTLVAGSCPKKAEKEPQNMSEISENSILHVTVNI